MIAARAEIGQVGDSLTTGNEGSLGAVRIYLPLAASLAAQFTGSAPSTISGVGGAGPAAPGVTTFNTGAPTWHIYAVDAQTIQQIRAFIQNLPTNITHLIFEGGTNDATNGVLQATSVAQLQGAMSDAIARFPDLRQMLVVGVTCIGEMYAVTGGVASFSGNTPVADATIDSLDAALKAAVQAQTGTNSHGQAITFTWVETRAPAAAALQANPSTPAPWQNAGYITEDGRHPKAGGLDVVFQNAVASVLIP